MLDFERAVLAIAIVRFVSTGYPVTWITIMCVAVAEPERDGAAPFALEVDIFGTVLLTICDTSTY